MPIGAALIAGGGSLLSGILGSQAATGAAQTQARSADKALQLQQNIDAIIQQQLAPFLSTGTNALSALAGDLGIPGGPAGAQALPGLFSGIPGGSLIPTGFQQSPGYAWQLQQGENAIQNSAAGKTGALSGNMLKALQGYGTGLANQDYWNWFQNTLGANTSQFNANLQNRNALLSPLFQLSGMGQNAAANLGNVGMGTAANAGNLLTSQGAALGAGQVGSTNALSGGINGLITALMGGGGYGGNNALAYILGGGAGTEGSWSSGAPPYV